MEDQPSHSKRYWGRVAYVLFLTVFTLGCVEIGARYYLGHVLQKASDNKFRFNHYRVYEHVPGFHEGDGKAALVYEAMAHNLAKNIGKLAVVEFDGQRVLISVTRGRIEKIADGARASSPAPVATTSTSGSDWRAR